MTSQGQGEYGLEPAPAASATPTPSPPTRVIPPPPFPQITARDLATQDVPCLNCGYNLRGLAPTSACPECGAPVQRSLHGNLLVFSSSEYVSTLSRGLLFILVGVIGSIVVSLGGTIIGVAIAVSGGMAGAANSAIVMSVAMLPISALLLYGWWLFSAPDPAIVGNQTGQKPRTIIRATVIIMAIAAMVNLLANASLGGRPGMNMAQNSASFFSFAAWVAQFFAALLYIRWLAPRIPDRLVYNNAGVYLWLLPVIYVVGFCMFFVGPLVSTVLFLLLLNNVRTRLDAIREQQASELKFPRTA